MSRSVRVISIVCAAFALVLASSIVAGAASKKLYTADVSPHSVSTGSTTTYTLTVTNKTLSQNLGSCNLTAPAGFSIGAVTQQPSTGTATKVGNVIQLRNMSTLPMTSRTVKFTATAPATVGVYSWVIDCRQANNYTPDQPSNQFTLDGANSNLKTTVSSPLPQADLSVSQTDSPDPVVGSNTVQYTVTVTNNGPATSGTLTLADTLPAGGQITSISGSGWTCTVASATSASCTSGALTTGVSAPSVQVLVLAPAADTTITNHASVSQSAVAADPNGANNVSDESTTVKKDSSCTTGTVSCGTGQITYSMFSQVTTGSTPSATAFAVGTTTFLGVAGATGGQIWTQSAPATPGSFCPVDLTDTAVTQCTWQMNLDPIPAIYPVGNVTSVVVCYVTRCPVGVFPMIVVKIDDAGNHHILPQCSGGTSECYEQMRDPGTSDLRITVRNLVSGDPKIAGVCFSGC